MFVRSIIAVLSIQFWMSIVPTVAQSREVPIIYPKDHAVVYDKVNLVLDPTEIPFFQVLVGSTEYPIVDTSAGRHAYQGLSMKPGINQITVRVFTLSSDPNKDALELADSRTITVFSKVGLFTRGSLPPDFREMFFHSREHEASCSGCHDLEVDKEASADPSNSEEVICSVCHRTLPVGNNVHEPVALWKCVICHDPNLYPVKYQFTLYDPWKFAKNKLPVKPRVITVAASELFQPGRDTLVSKNKAGKVFKEVVDSLKHNPGYKARLEVHADKALSEARARKLAAFLRESGLKNTSFAVEGMGDKLDGLSKATNTVPAGDRVEMVIYPSEVTVENNANLPVLKDRERIMVDLEYAQGPEINKLRILAKVPKGQQYVKGSAIVEGQPREPVIAGDDLIWNIGDKGTDFSEKLSYLLTKGKGDPTDDSEIRITYTAGKNEGARCFNYNIPVNSQRILEDTCRKCHSGITDKKFGHEPAYSGYCNLCHNPHVSSAPSLLREPSWMLCTQCHTDKTSGVHVLAGIKTGSSHPTKGPSDPSQPASQFSCVSCHNPHSANNKTLFVRNAEYFSELCKSCHQR